MSVLLLAEHGPDGLDAATLNAVTAAGQLGDVVVLVAGSGCQAASAAAAAAAVQGVVKVLLCSMDACAHRLAETVAPVVVGLCGDFSHIAAPATSSSRNLLPRVAAMLDVAAISDVVAICSSDTFVRPTYAGNVLTTVRSKDPIKVLTIRATSFDAAPTKEIAAPIEDLPSPTVSPLSRFVSEDLTRSGRPSLTAAKVVVSGGRGIGGKEGFRLLEQLADRLDAAVGASRAAVDSGFISNDFQIGQTGKVVAPELYIAIGISGAAQHLAGMKGSKIIVAIDKNSEAPIFQVADYGLAADLFEVLPQLINVLGPKREANV